MCGQQHLDGLGSESLHILLAQGPFLYQLAPLSSALSLPLSRPIPHQHLKTGFFSATRTHSKDKLYVHVHVHTHTLPQPHVISRTILFFLCLPLSLQNIWKFLSACLGSLLITPSPWPKLQLTVVSNNTLTLTPQLLLRRLFH